MTDAERFVWMTAVLRRRPDAWASVTGSSEYPRIHGTVRFYQTSCGVIVTAQISGLPQSTAVCETQFFGFHIHEGNKCSGNQEDPFADAGTHYNPESCPHPAHAGDLPPLLGNHGLAVQLFLTNRFTVQEITGRTVIIHMQPDDFTTQPAGNAGAKIACGIIHSIEPQEESI